MAKNAKLRTFASVRRQIGYDPCSRERRATPAQLDYVAQLILDCEGKPGFRWDYSHPESLTVSRASNLIEVLKRFKAADAALTAASPDEASS